MGTGPLCPCPGSRETLSYVKSRARVPDRQDAGSESKGSRMEIPRNRIYLVRHGQTASNRDRIVMGKRDEPLSEEGIVQAQSLSTALGGLSWDAAFSSDLERAHHTARIVVGERDLEIALLPGLAEQDYGDWEGLSFEELRKRHPSDALTLLTDPALIRIPGGEGFDEFKDRVIGTYEEKIRTDERNRDVLIVAHGGAIRILVCYFLGLEYSRNFFKLWVSNGSLTVVDELMPGTALLKRLNWTADGAD